MEGRDALLIASRVAGRGLMLKVGAVAFAVFLVFLIVLGAIGAVFQASSSAAAAGCAGAGLPPVPVDSGGGSTGGTGTSTGLHAQQLANAKTIDGVAISRGLSGKATFVALVTALQESTLINLDHGDRDSVGLFQQRPSAGWGAVADLMQPQYAANAFFGRGGNWPRGLTEVKGWENMEPGDAAQAVQASGYPLLYAGQEPEAKRIAQEAGIDLNRVGSTGSTSSPDPSASASAGASGAPVGGCDTGTGPSPAPGTPGSPFHDGNSPWPAVVTDPRSSAQAIEWARNEAGPNGRGDWYGGCLRFAATAYGWNYAGVTDPATGHSWALELYRNKIPASMHHDGDRNPPPGALLFWDTGSIYGHVAIYLGGGMTASTDIERPGHVDIVPTEKIESKWGARYVGWAPPYFPTAG